ncbi:MFS transporter [Aestuariibacter sp. GS-14]|uniref:MFS transporter n=1 Tax=Aestuariibacter sp. GS-14 TaxID=2590670 RepID=UPI00112A61F3|nr:MFS transporter [Aestuariibacter sp. GS-14]TPV60816.1 MFS transporter [Aestuariibacter sp. GS-14]
MSTSIVESVRRQIDQAPVSATQYVVFAIAFMLNVVDGFDVVAMSVAMPSLTADWGITATDKGYILSAALIGMTLGAMFLAPFADKIGRRNILLIATVMIGLSMVVTGFIPQSVEWMIVIRAISGLGIGIIFANSATIGAEFAPEKMRNLVVTIIVMGYATGATIVGPIANTIIESSGWEMVFVYGGLFTLLMTAVLYFYLPESIEFIATQDGDQNDKLHKINRILSSMGCAAIRELPQHTAEKQRISVTNLFRHDLGKQTVGVWLIYFMGFMSLYFLMSWIPTLFVNSGYERSEGIAALTLYNLGAVAGIILIGLIATKIKLAKPIAIYFVGSAIFLAVVAYWQPTSVLWLNILIFIIGFLLQGAFTAMYAMAARVYPTNVRATGIGWAAGLGRIGAILSPILAGYLVAAHWGMYDLFMLFALPLLFAGIIVFWFKH